jgi:hypothetical protein
VSHCSRVRPSPWIGVRSAPGTDRSPRPGTVARAGVGSARCTPSSGSGMSARRLGADPALVVRETAGRAGRARARSAPGCDGVPPHRRAPPDLGPALVAVRADADRRRPPGGGVALRGGDRGRHHRGRAGDGPAGGGHHLRRRLADLVAAAPRPPRRRHRPAPWTARPRATGWPAAAAASTSRPRRSVRAAWGGRAATADLVCSRPRPGRPRRLRRSGLPPMPRPRSATARRCRSGWSAASAAAARAALALGRHAAGRGRRAVGGRPRRRPALRSSPRLCGPAGPEPVADGLRRPRLPGGAPSCCAPRPSRPSCPGTSSSPTGARNRGVAFRVAQRLDEAGFSVWWDPKIAPASLRPA